MNDPATPATERTHGDHNLGYQLNIELLDRLIRVRLWGLWDLETTNCFVSDMLAGAKLLGGAGGAPWGALVDARSFMAQSPEVAELRQRTMIKLAQLGCHRIANVVESAAYTMQFNRLTTASHIESQVFKAVGPARAWLVSGTKGAGVSTARSAKRRPA